MLLKLASGFPAGIHLFFVHLGMDNAIFYGDLENFTTMWKSAEKLNSMQTAFSTLLQHKCSLTQTKDYECNLLFRFARNVTFIINQHTDYSNVHICKYVMHN
jgi:hypothetical protein